MMNPKRTLFHLEAVRVTFIGIVDRIDSRTAPDSVVTQSQVSTYSGDVYHDFNDGHLIMKVRVTTALFRISRVIIWNTEGGDGRVPGRGRRQPQPPRGAVSTGS